jgi:FAD/FMN-containing dehydrogenase
VVNKRELLKAAAWACLPGALAGAAWGDEPEPSRDRVRPGEPGWPSAAAWERLGRETDGRLVALTSPFSTAASASRRAEVLARLDNPFFVGDQPELTQTSGWLDAWQSLPSAYAVAAHGTADVVAAVNFAREHRLRLVVKGGGHSYQGTSDAPDSLLVWTRAMNDITLHDAFVPRGCTGAIAPQPAVSVGAGAMWIDAYDAVTTRGGRYVQGGGCTTVGVAGLVQSGGFGNFSKQYGTAAAGLLEAEIVTADGRVRVVNARNDPDLFWALKGGGGGSFGVVTRLTLRTRELPETGGGVFGAIEASTDEALRALYARVLEFSEATLVDPHWGEQIAFRGKGVAISMVFQGLSREQAAQAWQPLVDWVAAHEGCTFTKPLQFVALPGRHFWDAEFFRQHAPNLQVRDDRPGAPAHHVLWTGDREQVGWFIHAYKSAWLPQGLLRPERRAALAAALFAASRHWSVGLHFNKGLAGAPAAEIAAARDTATNPQVLDAFALAIIAGGGAPAFPGMPGTPRDATEAREDARDVGRAMSELLKVVPGAGAYVSESDYFQPDWENAFWGANHARLAAVKRVYDPEGLFYVRHGVGSADWSDDGFARVRG